MIGTGFVYLAVILDTWSRKVVGYGLGRNIDTRLSIAALNAAIAARCPAVSSTPIAAPSTPHPGTDAS